MLHFNFRSGKEEKSAKEYRECAAIHMNAVKSSMATFLHTGIIMFATVVAIVAMGRAWFVVNTNVSSTGGVISAQNNKSFYLATLRSDTDTQGVYDNNSQTDRNLPKALKHFQRITNETINGLPHFQVGTHTVTGKDDMEYIVGDADGISLMVNSTSNVNNTTQNAYVGPGSKGEMTFYIIPTIAGNNQVNITVSLAAYQLSEPNDGVVTAQLANNDQLRKSLCGHMLLFQGKDEQGNYVNQIDPELGEDGTIQFTFSKEDNWEINRTKIKLVVSILLCVAIQEGDDNTLHGENYVVGDTVQKNAEPLYWRTKNNGSEDKKEVFNRQDYSTAGTAADGMDIYYRYYVLELSWNTTAQETDLVYLLASH